MKNARRQNRDNKREEYTKYVLTDFQCLSIIQQYSTLNTDLTATVCIIVSTIDFRKMEWFDLKYLLRAHAEKENVKPKSLFIRVYIYI